MNVQEATNLSITEGEVRSIHDSNGNQLWGKLNYSVNYQGDTSQAVSPTPDAPQSINLVTGEQTITISDGETSEAFSIDLDSLQLCKIDEYQDYIYKSGSDWFIHKIIGSVTFTGDTDESWSGGNNNIYYFRTVSGTYTPEARNKKAAIISDYYPTLTYNQVASTTIDYGVALDSNNVGRFAIRNKDCANTAAFKTWLQSNNTTVYYPYAEATDTKITNSTLISQLEAIHTWLTRYGYTSNVVGNLPIIINQTTIS